MSYNYIYDIKEEALGEVVSDLRIEMGLPPYKLGDKVLCNLYRTSGVSFKGSIHSMQKSINQFIYLIDCPIGYGFLYTELAIKAKDLSKIDQNLYYRWVEENTLSLIYP